MGNRTYLIDSESSEPIPYRESPETALAAGKNCIPVYWFSLFDQSCLRNNKAVLRGKTEMYPYLVSSTDDARKRLSSRRELFVRFSDRSSQIVTQKWFEFVHALKTPFIHVDTAELWMLLGFRDCELHIVNCLNAFENRQPTEHSAENDRWLEILDASQIDLADLDKPIPSFKLAGFTWGNQRVPWE